MYFGAGSYGIRSAAERFFTTPVDGFGTRASDSTSSTCRRRRCCGAVIANPEGDNPFAHPDRALERRRETLDAMVEEGYITQAEADYAALAPLPTVLPPAELRPQNYFVEEVQKRLLADPRLGATESRAARPDCCAAASTCTRRSTRSRSSTRRWRSNTVLPDDPPFTAALVAVEPATGAVRAMVGGPGFEQLEYDIVTHEPGPTGGVGMEGDHARGRAREPATRRTTWSTGRRRAPSTTRPTAMYTTVNAEPSSGGP